MSARPLARCVPAPSLLPLTLTRLLPSVCLQFENVNDSNKLEDVVEFAKFTGITWDKDDKGFFYRVSPLLLFLDRLFRYAD